MSKTTYNIKLKGYVGGWDFDRSDVDSVLEANNGKTVNVLIDSLGGSLATGLSISAAFKNHGDVNVHFVGLNASAATIASLGAKHISIDAGAMYLVHKCSMSFFEWGSLNSDQFSTLIADCEKIKADLDKLDLNCAQLYAARCKRKTEDLLALMKVGGWLTAKEALDWGFVDEITDLADEEAPVLTDAVASVMANAGIPIPDIPVSDKDKEGAFARFLNAISALFNRKTIENSISKPMNKTYRLICAILGTTAIALTDSKASLSDEQLTSIEDALKEKDDLIAQKDTTIADLQARLDKKPADESKHVVDADKKTVEDKPQNDTEAFIATGISATKLFNSLP